MALHTVDDDDDDDGCWWWWCVERRRIQPEGECQAQNQHRL